MIYLLGALETMLKHCHFQALLFGCSDFYFYGLQSCQTFRCFVLLSKVWIYCRMFENRTPHMIENDYTPLSALNIFVKDLVRVQHIHEAC